MHKFMAFCGMKTINKKGGWYFAGLIYAFYVMYVGAAHAICSSETVTLCATPRHCTDYICNKYTDSGTGMALMAQNCFACEDGYMLKSKTITGNGSCSNIVVNECVCDTAAVTCDAPTEWKTNTNAGDDGFIVLGLQTRTSYSVNSETCQCEGQTNYRCDAGYYATAFHVSTTRPTCKLCPRLGGKNASSLPGGVFETSCYMPAERKIPDSTGTYMFVDNCQYTTL